jgi:hypothetical protein
VENIFNEETMTVRHTFILLVLAQGLHSVEEYIGRLWEVFLPAQFVSGLVSDNLEVGFLTLNIALFLFGLICWLALNRFTSVIIWFWIVLETVNGIVHTFVALSRMAYFPGLITAPILFILAIRLFKAQQLVDKSN